MQFPKIPIIALTGLADEDTAVKALRMDIQEYLIKGQTNSALLTRSIRYAIERKQAIEELRESEERLREAFAHAPVGMVLTDPDGRYLYTNRAYQEIVGYSEQELRQPDFDFRRLTHPEDVEDNIRAMKRLLSGEIPAFFIEKRCVRKDGGIVWVRLSTSIRRDAEGRPFQLVGLIENIDERKRLESRIQHMAHHDSLTCLPNRRLFQEVAGIELAQARRNRKKLATFFLDLDRFKEINDTLGHKIGDELLMETAARLKAVIRTSDTVARIGGDEFNLLIPDIRHPEYSSEVAQKILNEIRKPFRIRGHELNITASIGISIYPDDSEEIDTLLRYADIAMYYAKEHGRNRYQFYNPVINTRSLERSNFEASLRRAIEQAEFRLYFQPLVDIVTRKIVSVEVLLRWQHPERGLLLPGQFFREADDSGLMGEIDEWVLKAVSVQIKTWLNEGLSPACITMNVSATQFKSPDFVRRISGIMVETGLPPQCLAIEIAEATAMENIENTTELVQELTKIGVNVSIDNFGTGYSSLNHLRRLPVRKLKIDRSFVRDITTNSDDQAVVTAVLLMAHTMKLKVVAEGVEGIDQLKFLQTLQCDEAQGFLFGRPLPAERIGELVGSAK